ncbi:MAG: DUF1513 domain-containing protein [Gammaproteobacteria bacterium]|nr:DUF1513 domain-containing protein [Gammaproteobacteria bacterium]
MKQSKIPRLGLVMGGAQHVKNAAGERCYHLCVLDLDDPEFALVGIPTAFFGHGIVPHPTRPHLLSVFEKRGPGACEVDLRQGCVTRAISTAPDRQFYGHGAYSADGSLLYCTETEMSRERPGLIAVRDASTHELLGDFPSYGASPHDCRLIDGGRTMVITNGGGQRGDVTPSVTFVDVQSQQLLEQLRFSRADINAGHLDITTGGALAVVSAQREGLPDKHPGGVTLKLSSGEFRTLSRPKAVVDRLLGETLSVCIHEPTRTVAATTPAGNLLSFWDLDSGTLLRYYELPNPRGVSLGVDGEHFVVSFGLGDPPEALCLISAASLDKVDGFDLSPTGITGSHLTLHVLPESMRG